MHQTMARVWRGDSPYLRWLMYPLLITLSLINRIILSVREYMYRTNIFKTQEAPIPVISVGNISLGGTGKTPVVEKLSLWLKEQGCNPVIISRGYRREKKGVFQVDPRSETPRTAGDEAFMLARKTGVPVIVGVDRGEAIALGIRSVNAGVAILDDGFQRRDIVKDVEIVVMNGSLAPESLALFPLGSLREPVERVRNADVVLVNKGKPSDGLGPSNGLDPVMEGIPSFPIRHRPLHLVHMKGQRIGHYRYLKGKRIIAFSGLGDNESFFGLLEELGATIISRVPFPDHNGYTEKDLDRILSRGPVDMIVTTEKDAVKIECLKYPDNLFYLTIEMEIGDEERLFQTVLRKIEGKLCQIKC